MEVVNVTSQIAYEMLRFDCFIRSAAVSCSSYVPLLGAGGIWFLVDGQAGLCMASMHGWCMASVHGAGWVGGGLAYFTWTCDVSIIFIIIKECTSNRIDKYFSCNTTLNATLGTI